MWLQRKGRKMKNRSAFFQTILLFCIWVLCLLSYVYKNQYHNDNNSKSKSGDIFVGNSPEDNILEDGVYSNEQQQEVWIETRSNVDKIHIRIKNIMKKKLFVNDVDMVGVFNDKLQNRRKTTTINELRYIVPNPKIEIVKSQHKQEIRTDIENYYSNNNDNTNGCNGTNSRVLSYSMFGEKGEALSKFIPDILKEASQIPVYKTFAIRFYTDSKNVGILKQRFAKNRNIEFCDVRIFPDMHRRLPGMFWRFLPMIDPSCDVMCSRDLDSPLLHREGDAVEEWLRAGDKMIHVMRDKQYHNVPILGGMWCFRPSINRPLSQHIFDRMITRAKNPAAQHVRALDQKLLQEELWPLVRSSSVQHDSYYCEFFTGSVPFPSKRRDFHVGCVRDCSVGDVKECPVACRPKQHLDWKYC